MIMYIYNIKNIFIKKQSKIIEIKENYLIKNKTLKKRITKYEKIK